MPQRAMLVPKGVAGACAPAGGARRGVAYRICTRCVMDTTDPEIAFDSDGVCSHCRFFEQKVRPRWFPDDRGAALLRAMIARVRADRRGRPYDSLIGLSGGVDSSYLAVKAREWGLHPLAVHIDAGWNSELAVANIERIVTRLGLDLHTIVVDWQEMRDLQLAFLRANVANQDTPQDHVFFAGLYSYAVGNGFKYILSGANWATESILPKAWGYSAMDLRHIRAVHRRFGARPLSSLPLIGFFDCHIGYPYLRRMRVLSPLNFVEYRKDEAIAYLERNYDWRYYGGKHYESRWTRFFQAYYLPTKFGYDKRRAHLASLVMSGELTREAALDELARPLYTANELAADAAFVAKKLGIAVDELNALVSQPPVHHSAYPSNERLMDALVAAGRLARRCVTAARAASSAAKDRS
jgi:N-acetyl sugar amidotransferase